MAVTITGPFLLDKVEQLLLDGVWPTYNPANNPGNLWVCGYNNYGQLGQNDTTNRSSLVQIPGSWLNAACGYYHTLMIKSDNTLWACGANGQGQLGQNDTTNRSSLVQIPGSWITVAGGANHTLMRT